MFEEMMKSYKPIVALFLMQMSSITKGLNSWCSPYQTFCLFSEGIDTSVSDLLEAQLKCSEIKNDSWPVELGDERVKEVFIEFIHNHSISNVILNAFNRNGVWYWKNHSLVQMISSYSSGKGTLFYNNSKEQFVNGYAVVCMTGCHANWTDIDNSDYKSEVPAATHHPNIEMQTCKELCEITATCSSINWVYDIAWQGCWLHKYPYNASKMMPQPGTSHHVIDRTLKSVARCIGEGKEPNDPKKIVILVAIISILSVLTCVIVVVTLCLTKPTSGFYSQPDEDKLSQTIDEFDIVKEFIPREPNRYFGPRGDQYTEITLDEKLSVAGTLKKYKV